MPSLSVFRLPILWLYLGPPVFRLYGERMALDSLEGGQDMWNIFRFAWWMFWGAVALWELLRAQHVLVDFMRNLGNLPWLLVGFFLTLFASMLVSPAPGFTLANVVLMGVGMLAGLDLALKLYMGIVLFRQVLTRLLLFSLFLLTIIFGFYLFHPDMVAFMSYSGLRIRGNAVAYTPIIANVVIFSSLYLHATSRHSSRWLLLLTAAWGLWWLYMSQTRSAYLGFGIGVMILLWHVWHLSRRTDRLLVLVATGFVGVISLFMLYGMSHTVRWKVDRFIDRNVYRDELAVKDEAFATQSLATLNGRTYVAEILLEATSLRPFGLGFVAGPRQVLQSETIIEELDSISFGNAHNAFLEVYAGGGVFSLLLWLAIIGWIFWYARRSGPGDPALLRILLLIVLVQAVFESNMVLPFKQSAVLFWMLAAYVAAGRARDVRLARWAAHTQFSTAWRRPAPPPARRPGPVPVAPFPHQGA